MNSSKVLIYSIICSVALFFIVFWDLNHKNNSDNSFWFDNTSEHELQKGNSLEGGNNIFKEIPYFSDVADPKDKNSVFVVQWSNQKFADIRLVGTDKVIRVRIDINIEGIKKGAVIWPAVAFNGQNKERGILWIFVNPKSNREIKKKMTRYQYSRPALPRRGFL